MLKTKFRTPLRIIKKHPRKNYFDCAANRKIIKAKDLSAPLLIYIFFP
jgi:hypothetical protein